MNRLVDNSRDLPQDKLQHSLLLCLELCHVLIQAALKLVHYYIIDRLPSNNASQFCAAILNNHCLDHNMIQFNTKEQAALPLACVTVIFHP